MKTLVKTINIFFIALLFPVVAFAQLTVPQGGTGVTSVTASRILYGGTSLRLGSEAAFTYDASTNTLTADNGVFTSLTLGSVSNTEFGYLDGVTSAIQTQLNAKQATLGNNDITPNMVLSTGQTDEYCLSYEATGTTWEWKDCSGGGGGDSISIDGSAVVDPNFVSTGDIDFVNTTNTITANLNTASILEPDLSTDVVAADGDFLQYDSTGTNFTWRDASEVRTDLGLVIGTNVQAYDADLTTIAGLTEADGTFLVGTGAGWTTESGATARTSLGLGSLATLSTVNNSNWSGTDLSVANGGTGLSTFGGSNHILYTTAADTLASEAAFTYNSTTNILTVDTLNLTNALGIAYGGLGGAFTDPNADQLMFWDDSAAKITGISTLSGAAISGTTLTINDVTCTGCLGTTEIAGLDISNDTNLTAGRSLTLTGDDVAADAELYTDSKTIYFESPTASDDFKTIWVAPTGVTITSISCESDQTVNFDLQVDDGTPTGVNGSDIACTTFATDSTLAGDTTMASGDRMDIALTSVSGTPTWVSITFAYTKDD